MGDHSASRRVEVLKREAPHLLATTASTPDLRGKIVEALGLVNALERQFAHECDKADEETALLELFRLCRDTARDARDRLREACTMLREQR